MQAEKLACRKIVLRDLFRGPFHTASQCESGTVYDARRLSQVLPLRPVLHSRLLVAVNAKPGPREFRIKGLPAVEEKPSIHLTYTVKHLQEASTFNKNSSERSGCSQAHRMNRTPKESNKDWGGSVCTLRTGSPPAAHFCPFRSDPPRVEQP